MLNLKEYLIQNILRKDGTINGTRVNKLSLEYINEILDITSFCPEEISIYIRIKYIILQELKEFPKCPMCLINNLIVCRPCQLSITCGEKECTKKLKIQSTKNHFINKYGVTSYVLTDDFKIKSENTKLIKYGNNNYVLTDHFKTKSKNTKLIKYGNEVYNNHNKSKETKLKLYGDENYNNIIKYKETCLKKYGVDHIMQVPEFFIKQQINSYKTKYYNDKIYYRGNYELFFLEEINKANLLHKIINGFSLKYTHNGKNKVYFPDFILDHNNIKYIIEIKSVWTYDNCGKNNELKKLNDAKFEVASNIKGFQFILLMTKEEISSFVKKLTFKNMK